MQAVVVKLPLGKDQQVAAVALEAIALLREHQAVALRLNLRLMLLLGWLIPSLSALAALVVWHDHLGRQTEATPYLHQLILLAVAVAVGTEQKLGQRVVLAEEIKHLELVLVALELLIKDLLAVAVAAVLTELVAVEAAQAQSE